MFDLPSNERREYLCVFRPRSFHVSFTHVKRHKEFEFFAFSSFHIWEYLRRYAAVCRVSFVSNKIMKLCCRMVPLIALCCVAVMCLNCNCRHIRHTYICTFLPLPFYLSTFSFHTHLMIRLYITSTHTCVIYLFIYMLSLHFARA